jgi:serine/threonine protein kinase
VAASSGGRFSDEGTVTAYAADVVWDLAYLHQWSLVHGDVKTRNVVVGTDGCAKLADFKCARACCGCLRRCPMGTLRRMPPLAHDAHRRREYPSPASATLAAAAAYLLCAWARRADYREVRGEGERRGIGKNEWPVQVGVF